MKEMTREPTHPGHILLEHYMCPLNITAMELSETLNLYENHLVGIINGDLPVTEDLAEKLAKTFKTTTDLWVNLQKSYDDHWMKKAVSEEKT